MGQAAEQFGFAAGWIIRSQRIRGSICSSAARARTEGDVGCTICHDGQGSGTPSSGRRTRRTIRTKAARLGARVWLVRQPSLDLPDEAGSLRREQLPEVPSRSGRARAERAVPRAAGAEAGRRVELVREFGCFGCHEINGYDGPTKRSAPMCGWSRTTPKSPRRSWPNQGLESDRARAGELSCVRGNDRAKFAASCCGRFRRTPTGGKNEQCRCSSETPEQAAAHAGDACACRCA